MKKTDYAFILVLLIAVVFTSDLFYKSKLILPQDNFPSFIAAALFTILFIIWILSEIINNLISMSSSKGIYKDRGSFWPIVIGIFASIFIAIYFKVMNIGAYTNNIQYLGLILMFFGITLREYAIITLGKSFTVRVETNKNRKITKNGPYRYIRHPSYTGGLLTAIGIPLATGTWVGAILTFIIMMLVYNYRINVEEKALIESFGRKYLEYMKNTWKLFPGF